MATFSVISSAQPGNLVVDGAYIAQVAPQQALPVGPQTDQIVIIGPAAYGKTNILQWFSDAPSGYALYGTNTSLAHSLIREALTAMPECNVIGGIRVTDGTDVAATAVALDTAETPGTVLTGTLAETGSYPNAQAGFRIDLQSGTLSVSPVFSITTFFPGKNPQVFQNIIGYATLGSAYAPVNFKANALAALNGTAPNSIASADFIFTAGSSTATPQTATVFLASGGTDGASSISSDDLLGESLEVDSTGLYAAAGQVAGGQVIIAANVDPTIFGDIAAFCEQNLCLGWATFAPATTTTSAIATKQTNTMSNSNMLVAMDWDDVFDSYQGLPILVSPIGKLAGALASLDPWVSPVNKPYVGVLGVTSTERLQLGAINQTEAAQRIANGILWLGPTPRGPLGFPHPLTSAGTLIADTRMFNYCAYLIGSAAAQVVGEPLETTLPVAQADEKDARILLKAKIDAIFGPMLTPNNMQISAYSNVVNDTNNTQNSMQQGNVLANVSVTTLTGARFAVVALQVGSSVQIQTTPLQSAA